ncbi:MAG: capsule assembly Wzi family protein [Smithellaceae bacterium]
MKKRRLASALTLLVLLLIFTNTGRTLAAASSVNVPLDHPIYSSLDRWGAQGLVSGQLSSLRPVTRKEAGRQIAQVLQHCEQASLESAACRDAVYFSKSFAMEVAAASDPEASHAWAFKPVDTARVSYAYIDGSFSQFNQDGIEMTRGHNAVIRTQSHATLWRYFSAYVEPAFIYNQYFGTEENTRSTLRLNKGYAKATAGPLELLVGRDALWWGPGYHGTLLMTNNAHPFDMIKLSNPEPAVLPWWLGLLGPVQFNLIFSQLNDERSGRELANPFLYGLRLNLKPHRFVEIGASHLVQFGGPGRRDMTISEIFKTLYSNDNHDREKVDSNQQVSVDIALTLPELSKYLKVVDAVKVYLEVGAEDSGYPPDRRAYVTGFALYRLFGLDNTVLRAEYAIMSPYSVPGAWYDHAWYPMRYEGRVFGHHAGTDAEDIFLEWSQDFTKAGYKIGFDRERSGVQTRRESVQNKDQFFVELDYRFIEQLRVTGRYTFENITNHRNAPGADQRNHYFGLEAVYMF